MPILIATAKAAALIEGHVDSVMGMPVDLTLKLMNLVLHDLHVQAGGDVSHPHSISAANSWHK